MYATRFPHPGLSGQRQRAVRTERFKLIQNVNNGERELYDLEADPFELDDLLVTAPGPQTDRTAERLLRLVPRFP